MSGPRDLGSYCPSCRAVIWFGNSTGARVQDRDIGMAEAASSWKAIESAITSAWARGSLLLWGLATACAALAATLRVCAYLELQKAGALWAEYGLILILLSVGLVILASFKTFGEREKPNLSLIAIEEQSFWQHATQADGSVITGLDLRFQATNMGDGTIWLSSIKLNWPWVRHRSIITKILMTEQRTENDHGLRDPIMPHSLTEVSAHILIKRAVGGIGKKGTMRVSVSLQDHAGRWQKLVFPRLRNPAVQP
jgi:hypothetical protein